MKRLPLDVKTFLAGMVIAFFVCLIEIVLVFVLEMQITEYPFKWELVPVKFTFFTFGMWVFLYYLADKRLEFEAEQSYHRRRGRAAVEGQKAEEESRKSLTHDFKGFRRMNPRVN